MFAFALTSLLTFAQPTQGTVVLARSTVGNVGRAQTGSVAPGEAGNVDAADTAPTALPIGPDAVVIRNSGSTNTLGYTIAVSPDGAALVAQNGTALHKTLSASQTAELFGDVRALMPLAAGPARPCMRSVSFGSSTTVSYQNAMTSDLSCRSDAASAQLRGTIAAIVRALDVQILPRARMQP